MLPRYLLIVCLSLACTGLQAHLPELIPIRKGKLFGYCDGQAQQIRIPFQYEDANPFQDEIAVVRYQGKLGLIDTAGQWRIAPMLDDVQIGRCLRLGKAGKYALADSKGHILTDFVFDRLDELKNGFVLTDIQGLKGYADASGKVIVPNQYAYLSQMRDNQGNFVDLILSQDGGLKGLVNVCGQEVQPPRFSNVQVFEEGFAVVQEADKFGLIDVEGNLRTPCVYDQILPMSEGLCAAKLKNRWGFINADGEEILPFTLEAVQQHGFYHGRAAVSIAGNWVFMNRQGLVEIALEGDYLGLGNLSEGLAAVCSMRESGTVKYGYVDADGKLKIGFRFDKAEVFVRGFAIVGQKVEKQQSMVKELRFGIVDRHGKLVIPPILDSQTTARLKRDSLGYLGYASLESKGRSCFVDGHGNVFGCESNPIDDIQRKFMSSRCESQALIAVAIDGRWGFADRKGKLSIPCIYLNVECFQNGLARVWPANGNGQDSFFIDESGRQYLISDAPSN